MGLGRGHVRKEFHELELRIRGGGSAVGERPEPVADLGDSRRSRCGIDVDACDADQLAQCRANCGRLGLAADVAKDQPHIIPSCGLSITRRIPGRPPHDRTREGVADIGKMLRGDLERSLVKTNLRVGEVIVVHKHQVGAGLSDERSDIRSLTINVDLDAMIPAERAVGEIVETNRETVRPDRRVVDGGLLLHDERRDRPVRCGLDQRTQGVHAGGLEPELRPLAQIATTGLLQLDHEVAQFGVAELVLGEVVADPQHEFGQAHPRNELLEDRAALGVGDSIEVDLDILEVIDGGDDRVSGWQLVLFVCPAFLHRLEGRPGLGPLGSLGGGEGRCPLREALIEPQVVPPFHGHQVAEPHVGELVEDRHNPTFLDRVGHLGAKDVRLGERDRARVLHGAGVELGHEKLVVLLEWVRVVEVLLVELETLLGLLEDVVRIQELAERRAGEDSEGDDPAIAGGEFVVHRDVGACHDRCDIARQDAGGGEGPGGEVPIEHRLGRG